MNNRPIFSKIIRYIIRYIIKYLFRLKEKYMDIDYTYLLTINNEKYFITSNKSFKHIKKAYKKACSITNLQFNSGKNYTNYKYSSQSEFIKNIISKELLLENQYKNLNDNDILLPDRYKKYLNKEDYINILIKFICKGNPKIKLTYINNITNYNVLYSYKFDNFLISIIEEI